MQYSSRFSRVIRAMRAKNEKREFSCFESNVEMFVFVFALFLFFWRWHMFFRWHWNEINRNHGRKRKRARTVDQWLHSLEHCRAACTSAALRELHYGVRCVASCTTAVFVAQPFSAYAPTEAISSSALFLVPFSIFFSECLCDASSGFSFFSSRWRLFVVSSQTIDE